MCYAIISTLLCTYVMIIYFLFFVKCFVSWSHMQIHLFNYLFKSLILSDIYWLIPCKLFKYYNHHLASYLINLVWLSKIVIIYYCRMLFLIVCVDGWKHALWHLSKPLAHLFVFLYVLFYVFQGTISCCNIWQHNSKHHPAHKLFFLFRTQSFVFRSKDL